MAKRHFFAVVLMTAALLTATMGAVNADLKTTNVLRSYDDGSGQYENGNITMFLDGLPQPFYTQLDWDNDDHADACGVGTTSDFAGDAVIGLYHTDNAPAGAPGFQSTLNWSLVPCSVFDTKKYPEPADILASCIPGNPEDGDCVLIGAPDQVLACTTGNCQDEIQTVFHVKVDSTCDNAVDQKYLDAGEVCMYWEAVKPPAVTPAWKGNFQVRYRADADTSSGEKTINFKDPLGPNAVSLSSLSAVAEMNSGSLAAIAAAMLLAAAALFVWRWRA